jgi:hypothetical protein
MVAANSSFIVFIRKITTFTYKIRHLDPLTQTVSSFITSSFFIHYTENIVKYIPLSMIYIDL